MHNGLPMSYTVLFSFLAVLMVGIIIFGIFLSTKIERKDPPPSVESTGDAETTEDADHVAVVYPSAPSRDSYLLSGNGAEINGESISAASAILVSLKDYAVQASLAPDTKIYPASMTKIMTLIVACENIQDASVMLEINERVFDACRKAGAPTIASTPKGSNAYLYPDSYTATSLLYGVGVISAADAAVALAEHIFGSEEAFVEKMNEKVRELGLTGTHFSNCTGLDDEDNYSTVREIAIILAYALDNEFCRTILSTESISVVAHFTDGEGVKKTYNRFLSNTLLERLNGAGYTQKLPVKLPSGLTLVGGKTGYTDEGKYCLATFARDAEGNLYIAVTAASPRMAGSATDTNAVYRYAVKE